MRSSALLLLVTSILLGCGRQQQPLAAPPPAAVAQATPPATAVEAASAPAPEPAPPPAEPLAPALPDDVDVALRAELPKDYVEDGKLDEWGDVCAPPMSRPSSTGTPSPTRAPTRSRAPAPTCLTVVVLPDKVVMAGRLGKDGLDGLWLGVTMPLPKAFPSPRVGLGRGNEIDCERPEPARAGLCKRHMQRVLEAAESTGRYYRLTTEAFVAHAMRGGLPAARGAALPDAHVARSAQKDAFEITLPLSALPRAGAAPVEALYTVHGAGPLPKHQLKWVQRPLPGPASLAPFGELRAEVMGAVLGSGLGIALYQPGSDEIEVFAASGDGATREMTSKTRKLFAPKAKTDALEAGVAPGLPHDLLVLKPKDSPPRIAKLDGHRLVDVALVDGELRAFSMSTSCETEAPCSAAVRASRIANDGSLEALLMTLPDGADTSLVDSATPYVEKSGAVFGVRGSTTKDGARATFDLRFTWSAATKKYEGSWKGPR